MSPSPNTKFCPKCEESVHPEAIICPFCRSTINGSKKSEETSSSSEEPVTSPYRFVPKLVAEQAVPTPLYSPSPARDSVQSAEVPKIIPRAAPTSQKRSESKTETGIDESVGFASLKEMMVPLVGLLSGVIFFLFGLVLLLFSHEGVFTLHWSSSYWPAYLFGSLPLFVWGWRALQQLDHK